MNSLLKRQIRKFLSSEIAEKEELQEFLKAVNLSYNNFDEQAVMIQRAMQLSSEELYQANKQLRKETISQQKVIDQLRGIINTLKMYELSGDKNANVLELDGSKLATHINNQATEIVKISRQREELVRSLEMQNEELSNYAHMVSHDLKSPLRSIDVLSLWLLEDFSDKLSADAIENLNLIRSNVQKMDALITGILEYASIDKQASDEYDVDLDFKVHEIIKSIYIPAHIQITIKNKLPVVKGNNQRLHQLFQNLITNAIKYNDKEKGTIAIGVSESPKFWEFYIKDNGIGIEKQYFDKIFKTFEKLENNPDSTGIGLSIVKKVVEYYHGKIWLTSTPNKGTTFYFTLKK